MPTPVACVAQEHTDLAILDSTCRATVLTLYTARVFPLLEETRLIHDQHGSRLAGLFNDVVAKDVASRVWIPLCPLKKVLHTIGCIFADSSRELPAVLAIDCARQTF
jgi:hypothetical protein